MLNPTSETSEAYSLVVTDSFAVNVSETKLLASVGTISVNAGSSRSKFL